MPWVRLPRIKSWVGWPHRSGHSTCRLLRIVMFPDANDPPPGIDEMAVCVLVPDDVPGDLAGPELGVPGGWSMMFGAPMPETPVQKHSDLRSREHKVGPPPKLRQRLRVDSVSQAQRMHGGSQSQFRSCVPSPVAPHHGANRRRARPTGRFGHPSSVGRGYSSRCLRYSFASSSICPDVSGRGCSWFAHARPGCTAFPA